MPQAAEVAARGLDYLYFMRSLSPEPDAIDVLFSPALRTPICTSIGTYITTINTRLNLCLQACHDCLHPWQRPQVQIFATPLAAAFGLDGLCNLKTQPITILVDVGRVWPDDWLALVAHEYAHACLNQPGHCNQFAQLISHLASGLHLPPPLLPSPSWHHFPPYRSTPDPLAFWLSPPQSYL